jgi:hypothetical protein
LFIAIMITIFFCILEPLIFSFLPFCILSGLFFIWTFIYFLTYCMYVILYCFIYLYTFFLGAKKILNS